MPSIVADRVAETTTTTGTGALTLAGALTGFRTFASVCATGDTVEYCIEAVTAGVPSGAWETGYGTYSSSNTLTRTTLKDSSTGSAVSFAAGTKNVLLVSIATAESTFLFPSGDTSGAKDTANILAIQAKFAARRIVLGTGTFYLNARIPMRAFDTIVGQGIGLTYIYPVGTITMFGYSSASTVQAWNLRDVTMFGYSNDSIAIDTKISTGSIQDVNITQVYFDGFGNGMGTNANPAIKIGDPWGFRMINALVEQTGDRPAITITNNSTSTTGAMLTNCKIKNNAGTNLTMTGLVCAQVIGCELYTTGTSKYNILIDGGSGNMLLGNAILGAGTSNTGVRSTNTSLGNQILGGSINGQSATTFTGIVFDSGCTLGKVTALMYGCPTFYTDNAGATGFDFISDGTLGGYHRPPMSTPAIRASAASSTGIGFITVDSTDGVVYSKQTTASGFQPLGPARTFLPSDVTNNNASANTIADVTALSFAVLSGGKYKFKFFISYTAAATTTGARFSINGPTVTSLHYRSEYSLTTTSRTFNDGLTAYDQPAASNATSATTTTNIAIVEGIIAPSANGTVIARFASEVSSSAIVAKANLSYVEFELV